MHGNGSLSFLLVLYDVHIVESRDSTVHNCSLWTLSQPSVLCWPFLITTAFFVLSVCLRLTWSVIEWLPGPLLWWRRSVSILLIVPFPLWEIFFLFSAVPRRSSSKYWSARLYSIWKLLTFSCHLFFVDSQRPSMFPSTVTDSPLCPLIFFLVSFFSLTFPFGFAFPCNVS